VSNALPSEYETAAAAASQPANVAWRPHCTAVGDNVTRGCSGPPGSAGSHGSGSGSGAGSGTCGSASSPCIRWVSSSVASVGTQTHACRYDRAVATARTDFFCSQCAHNAYRSYSNGRSAPVHKFQPECGTCGSRGPMGDDWELGERRMPCTRPRNSACAWRRTDQRQSAVNARMTPRSPRAARP
jgi:hypothetical protein